MTKSVLCPEPFCLKRFDVHVSNLDGEPVIPDNCPVCGHSFSLDEFANLEDEARNSA